jgi:4-amino-4-deoxy-L-arabinose transferase-like glycosyltransferase
MTALTRTFSIVFIVAIGVRLVAAFALGGFANPERWEYDDIARAIVAGQGFTYHFHGITYYSYAPPLYSWLSVASYWLSGSLAPLMLIQVGAGAALAVASGAMAGRLFGNTRAVIAAGVLVAMHPGLVIYSATKAHPMTWDALFFALAALQFLRLREQLGLRRALELGLIVGIGTLSRATIIIFLPIGALWLLGNSRRSAWPAIVRDLVVAGVITTACLAPWTIRNYLVHHEFVFVVSTDGDTFWRGNNPNATGHSYGQNGRLVLDSLTLEEWQDLERQPTEVAQSAWFKARAKAFIRDHPWEFVRLTAMKFFHFWWFAPQTGVRYPASWFWASAAYYVATLLCAGVGVHRILKAGSPAVRQAVLLVALLLALSLLQSLYYVEGRHRWGVEPLLLVISGGGAAAVYQRLKNAR